MGDKARRQALKCYNACFPKKKWYFKETWHASWHVPMQVVTPLVEQIQQLTKQSGTQPVLYQATAVLASLAKDCG